MGHIKDRWTQPGEKSRRIKNDRWGHGKRWQARWVDAGGERRAKSFGTKDAAEAHLAQVATGQYQQPTQQPRTFGAYAGQWMESQLHQRPQTRDAMTERFRNIILPELGGMRLDAVTRADVQRAVSRWSGSYAPSTVHIAYGYVATVFRHAVEDRLLQFSPCVRISLPVVPRKTLIPLTATQVAEIAERVPAHYRNMAILTAATGLRSGEVRGLTVDRVLDGGMVLRVDRQLVRTEAGVPVFGPPKSDAGFRTLNLGAVAQQAIKDHLASFEPGPEGLLFTGRTHKPISRSDAGEVWRQATRGMDLRDRSGWHDLRHYCASLLIAEGLSVRAVADWMGHKDPVETLRTYSHLWPSDTERIATAIDSELRDLFGSHPHGGPEGDQDG